MRKKISLIFQGIIVAAGICLLSAFAFIAHLVTPASTEENWIEFEIPQGASFRTGLGVLEKNELIRSKKALLFLGRILRAEKRMKPGYYCMSASMTPLQIFDDIVSGKTIQYSVTIPEGSTLKSIKDKFIKAGLMTEEDWKNVRDKDFLLDLQINAPSLEGYMFPDTYKFAKGIDPKIIFKILVQRLREQLDVSLMTRAEKIGMTENQVLTLASIIEKEALYNSERPIISAVYHNRLKKKMRLQADPTVRYGLQKNGRIRYKDLRKKTPYNTYVIRGLPPGPIASPGIKSIRAALYPADVDYLFFVGKNNGMHYFSSTGEEHVKAVTYYQVNNGTGEFEKEKKDKTNIVGWN